MKSTSMRKPLLFSAVLILFLQVPASITWAQTITTQKGLTTAVFFTNYGNVKVHLPGDIRPGDNISGTVIAEPSGKNDKEKKRNLQEMTKYVISLGGNKISVPANPVSFEWLIHLDRNIAAPMELLNISGIKVAELSPVLNTVSAATVPGILDYSIPQKIVLTDEPLIVLSPYGNMNPHLAYTLQDAAGKKIVIKPKTLSPRQATFDLPKDLLLGNTIITVKVAGHGGENVVPAEQVSFNFSVVQFEFKAQKDNLKKGEKTSIWWWLKGLDTNRTKLPMMVMENLTPANINIPAGNFQVVNITPANANTRNEQPITALVNGPFNISASVYLQDNDFCDAFSPQMRVIKTKKDYDAWTTALKKDLAAYIKKQGTDNVGQAAKRNAQTVIDNIPPCSDDGKVSDCLGMVNLYLRNIAIPMAAATLWLSGFEAYQAAIKVITGCLGGKPELIDWDVIRNGLKFIEVMGKELDDETLQTKTKEAQQILESAKKANAAKDKLQELKNKLDELNQYAKDKKIGMELPPAHHYSAAWLSNVSWNEFFDRPVNYYDLPKTEAQNKMDTIPCKTLEDSLAKLEQKLHDLEMELLIGIDDAIKKAAKAVKDCNLAIQPLKDIADKANKAFSPFEKGMKSAKSNLASGQMSKADFDKYDEKYKEAEKKKAEADDALNKQKAKCDLLDKSLKALQKRKETGLPGEINDAKDAIARLKELIEKCKQKEADEKKRKEEFEKWKADREKEIEEGRKRNEDLRRKQIETNSYLLINIHELGLINSDEFWEMKGVWDKIPELAAKLGIDLSSDNAAAAIKALGDGGEDLAGVPGSTDVIQALGGLYQVIAKMKDPCFGLGMSTIQNQLMNRTNKVTGTLYTNTEAQDKVTGMCNMMQMLKKVSAMAAGK